MVPYHCDALLPVANRYASQKFRRLARGFSIARMDYGDACELVAFLELVPFRFARWIFAWPKGFQPHVDRLQAAFREYGEVVAMVEANSVRVDRETGLAVLKAMQDGGWEGGGVPNVVRLALLDMRDAGMSRPAIADALGVTIDQLRRMDGSRRRAARARVPLTGLIAF